MKAPIFELPFLDSPNQTFNLEDVLGKKVVLITFGCHGALTALVTFLKRAVL
ncbi:hypothetical protein [Piscibacillus salipiscarius]|uniref:hypothetical protein n=1 Tax=Piscibacillus salipiscarius TaxID=299480 RepID=UPI002436DD3D|nr:hypothetical protein [Piscibacillus salipiscarius]